MSSNLTDTQSEALQQIADMLNGGDLPGIDVAKIDKKLQNKAHKGELHDPYNTGFDRGEYLALRKVAAILYKNFGIVPSKTSWFRTVERSEACMLQPKKFQKLYPCDFEHPPSNWPVNDAHKRVALPKEYLYQGEQNDT